MLVTNCKISIEAGIDLEKAGYSHLKIGLLNKPTDI